MRALLSPWTHDGPPLTSAQRIATALAIIELTELSGRAWRAKARARGYTPAAIRVVSANKRAFASIARTAIWPALRVNVSFQPSADRRKDRT